VNNTSLSQGEQLQKHIIVNQFKEKQLRAQCGTIGNIIGSGENAKINIIACIAFLFFILNAGHIMYYGFEKSKDLLLTTLPIITTAIGYLTGSKNKVE